MVRPAHSGSLSERLDYTTDPWTTMVANQWSMDPVVDMYGGFFVIPLQGPTYGPSSNP